MITVKLEKIDAETSAFNLYFDQDKIGEMVVNLSPTEMIVYHTEIDNSHEGKGYGLLLLDEMVNYARTNQVEVFPICEYVNQKFQSNPQAYSDIWKPSEREF